MQDPAKVEFVEELWVQCDEASCRKWRRLPVGTLVDGQQRWYCYLNPDTRYNSCDIDEELYDERNEILLTGLEGTKSKSKGKRKRGDSKSAATEQKARLMAELQKRKEWCAKKLNSLATEDIQKWSVEDFHLLQIHAPETADLVIECTDIHSALSYFQVCYAPGVESEICVRQGGRGKCEQFADATLWMQCQSVRLALVKMSTEVEKLIQEASTL